MPATTYTAAELRLDLRYLYDVLYTNRALSVIDGYFSLSDIELLTLGHVYETGLTLTQLITIATSKGVWLRFWVSDLSTDTDPVYIYKANPNVLLANPTNINIFLGAAGTCPAVPSCLLAIPGTYQYTKASSWISQRDPGQSSYSFGGYIGPVALQHTPNFDHQYFYYGPLQQSRTCSCSCLTEECQIELAARAAPEAPSTMPVMSTIPLDKESSGPCGSA